MAGKPLFSCEMPSEAAILFQGLESSRGLLLAVSGGSDSLALMVLIDEWHKARVLAGMLPVPPVYVATVDHGLRCASLAEAQKVGMWAHERHLPHQILSWTGPKPVTGIPSAARTMRYRLLADHAASLGCDKILTGHHAEDQAETVLMRLLAGSGVSGLAGMAAFAPVPDLPESASGPDRLTLVRPLLGLPKAALQKICAVHSLIPFEDVTNEDKRFRRPQLRAIASILEHHGLTSMALQRLANRAARAGAALDQYARERFALLPAQRSERLFSVARDEIDRLPDELLLRLIKQEIARLSPHGHARLAQLEAVLAGLRAQTCFVKSLAGLVIRADADQLQLSPEPPRKLRPEVRH